MKETDLRVAGRMELAVGITHGSCYLTRSVVLSSQPRLAIATVPSSDIQHGSKADAARGDTQGLSAHKMPAGLPDNTLPCCPAHEPSSGVSITRAPSPPVRAERGLMDMGASPALNSLSGVPWGGSHFSGFHKLCGFPSAGRLRITAPQDWLSVPRGSASWLHSNIHSDCQH